MDIHRETTVGVEPVSDKTLQLEAQTSAKEGEAAARGTATEIK